MQRRNFVAAFLVALLVVLAGSWFGFSRIDGVTPVEPASDAAATISDLYIFIGVFAGLIFLSVTIPLALIISRYRERGLPREVEGPQVRGNTRLEVGWTVASCLIVLVIVAATLIAANGINDPEPVARAAASAQGGAVEGERLPVLVEGRQFYWRFVYENGAVAVDTLRIPVDRVADLTITAPDVDVAHSFWVPALHGKMDAIPGVTNHLRLLPNRTGTFRGRCAELCGIQHSVMNLEVVVMESAEFDAWLDENGEEQPELGQELFDNVCSKCHFAAPEYAPNIAGSPILQDPEQVEEIVTNGIRRMPPVGRGWSERELDALTDFFAAPGGEDDGDQS